MERKIFNHPIRKETTLEFFPNKISINDFKNIIVKPFDAFESNMKNLSGIALNDKYIEEWIEQYLAWLEIEEEK